MSPRTNAAQQAWRAANPDKVKAYRANSKEKAKITVKAWLAVNKQKVSAYQKTYRAANLAKAKERQQAWRTANPDKVKSRELRYRYGITLEVFSQMLAAQEGACAICRTTDFGKAGPCVDHDHETEANRGLLCARCNMFLGLAKENPQTLLNAINYLEQYREPIPSGDTAADAPIKWPSGRHLEDT